MTTKNREHESMTRVQRLECVVRVWCTETEWRPGPRPEIEGAIRRIVYYGDAHDLARSIGKVLDEFEDVSAYEILDEQGNGAIVYPDWK